MIVVLFFSKLTEQAGDEYIATDQRLMEKARSAPGFVDVKSFTAADGERLTIVWWKDLETLRAWREDPEHRAAQAQVVKESHSSLESLAFMSERLRPSQALEPLEDVQALLPPEVGRSWQSFLLDNGGTWQGYVDARNGRAVSLEGSGIPAPRLSDVGGTETDAVGARQVNRKAGAGTRFASDLDAAAALLDEAVHHGKSQPGAFPGIFRREERLKQVALDFLRHPDPCVGDPQRDVAPRRHPGPSHGEVFGEMDLAGFDRQLAPVRHRIPRVDGEIE